MKVFILLLIVLIVLIVLYSNKETYKNYKNFNKDIFIKNVNKCKITYLVYKNDNLNAYKYIDSTIEEFLKNNNDKSKRYQIKQKFDNNGLSNYVYNYGYKPMVRKLKLKNVNPGFIRMSKFKWSFDYHYDCVDLILVQLIGTRIIYTKKSIDGVETKNILNSGKYLYIPMGVYHKVEIPSELNLNYSIEIDSDINNIKKCNKKFEKDFKVQHIKCLKNNCI